MLKGYLKYKFSIHENKNKILLKVPKELFNLFHHSIKDLKAHR